MFKRALLGCTTRSGGLAFSCQNADDASGMDLYDAACVLKDAPEGYIFGKIKCQSHQCQHVILTLFAGVIPMQSISGLQRVTSFVGLGSHLLRCNLAVTAYLSQPGKVVIVTGEVQQEDLDFAKVV